METRLLTTSSHEIVPDLHAQMDLGRLHIQQECSPEGIFSSISLIKRHIEGLETTDPKKFAFSLGVLYHFSSLNPSRAGILMGQNFKILHYLNKHSNNVLLLLPILKIVALIGSMARHSSALEKAMKEIFVVKAITVLEELVSTCRTRNTKEYQNNVESNNTSKVQCLEQVDFQGATALYCLLILENHLSQQMFRQKSTLSSTLFESFMMVSGNFSRLDEGDIRTGIINSINNVMRESVKYLDLETVVNRFPDLLTLSLIFQQKSEHVYALQPFLEEFVDKNKQELSLVLVHFLFDQSQLSSTILRHCTKLRSILFMITILSRCHPVYASRFLDQGGRAVYLSLLSSHLASHTLPSLYIFLEDPDLLSTMSPSQETMLSTLMNRILNSHPPYQYASRLAAFSGQLALRKRVMRDQEGGGWEVEMWRVGEGERREGLGGKVGVWGLGLSQAGSEGARGEGARLYDFGFKHELTTREMGVLQKELFFYNKRQDRLELNGDKEMRVIYHREINRKRGQYFAVLEINKGHDKIVLEAIVYSKTNRKILISITLKIIEAGNNEGRPFYENDFVTLCPIKLKDGRKDLLIVTLDKSNGINTVSYTPIYQRNTAQELMGFEDLFRSQGIEFDTARTFTIASSANTVLIGCKHMIAVLRAGESNLEIQSVVTETEFSISKIRLMDNTSSSFLALGYMSQEYNIVDVSHHKIHKYLLSWLNSGQIITDVEVMDNHLVHHIEDTQKKATHTILSPFPTSKLLQSPSL